MRRDPSFSWLPSINCFPQSILLFAGHGARRNEKQSMKREKHRERYLRRGAHSIGSHEFFQSDEKLHQDTHRPLVRSADVKIRESRAFYFFFAFMKWTSLLPNIIIRCEIKKIASLRQAVGGGSMLGSPITLRGAILSSSSNITLASCFAAPFLLLLFWLSILFLLSSLPYPRLYSKVRCFFLRFALRFNSGIHARIQLSQLLFLPFIQKNCTEVILLSTGFTYIWMFY